MVSRQSRIEGMIWGQLVGDALALGSHWHYDLEKRNGEIYPAGIHGFEQPVAGHYHEGRQPGDFTHYGDAAVVLLQSVRDKGGFDVHGYAEHFIDSFRQYKGYLDKATKGTLANAAQLSESYLAIGADDNQTGAMSRLAPVTALMSVGPELDAAMMAAANVTQTTSVALDANRFHGRLLARLLAGEPLNSAIDAAAEDTQSAFVSEALAQAKGHLQDTVVDATGTFGRACSLPSTLPSMLHAVLREGHSLPSCLLEIVRAGGDNASRASVVGAWLGAHHSLDAIPAPWRRQLTRGDEIEPLVKVVTSLAAG